MKLTLDIAKLLLNEAVRKSKELGIVENIAVVDDGGNLIAFERMDNGKIAGIAIAIDKAWTAIGLQTPTANLSATSVPNGPQYGLNTTNNGRVVVLGGGIPLVTNGGHFVGAIGVSGSTSANDILVAQAAATLFASLPIARIGSSGLRALNLY
ncbi:GlcG/HbpS family heme-binding protein [Paenibacillus glycinis]|uniref:Heme-binding protein n=1 Tax=Paenibacillus glycinis TaxID=2697035 RepID=A0ABW9XZF8_9BACL|nr:heme-binding protein [Paenibacillus glycinis]NBD27798.1 heme-binding protein [Paenibacillus glycinis]